MTFIHIEPSQQLLTKLFELYLKYIHDTNMQANKYELIFIELEKNINDSNIEIKKSYKFFCENYKQIYITNFEKLKKEQEDLFINLDTKIDFKLINIELITHFIDFAKQFKYDKSISLITCVENYYSELIKHLKYIKQFVKDNAIPVLYEHIKENIEQIKIKENIKQIENINNSILEVENIGENIDKIIGELNKLAEIPENISDDHKYLLNQLKEKYKEFLFITTNNFTQEIKNKIKKSVIEIVLIEIKLQKRLNLKKPLLITNAIKEFFDI